jgi:tRNA modification GTPase
LRESADAVEAIGVERAARLVEVADVLLWLGEAADAPGHPRLIRVHAKADLAGRESASEGSIAVSSVTGEGLSKLLRRIEALARGGLLPAEDAIALNRRQAAQLEDARDALEHALGARDPVLIAEDLRLARSAFDRLTGRAGVEEVLDALFSRFCLGK